MLKILGIGNALVDIMIRLDSEALLESLSLPKGSMQLVDEKLCEKILETVKEKDQHLASGGSAANTIHGIASLGGKAGYIGMVGEDELGGFFIRDMINAGVDPQLIHSPHVTGRAIALVTPDSERTFATYLGAAIELSEEHLSPEQFRGSSILHLEGYLVQNHALVERAVKIARDAGMTISLDLASYNVVEANLDFLQQIVTNYVDILFANEEEAKSFTGLPPEEALRKMAGMVRTAIVKIGRNGSLAIQKGQRVKIEAINADPVDTTGAGDLYASGFLYGIAGNYDIQQCGRLGALLAGNVIECVGAKMDPDRWKEIRKQTGL